MTDDISQLLRPSRYLASVFGHRQLLTGWCYRSPSLDQIKDYLIVPSERVVVLHLLVYGRCWSWVPGSNEIELSQGDMLFLPSAREHFLSRKAEKQEAAVSLLDGEVSKPVRGQYKQKSISFDSTAEIISGFIAFDGDPCLSTILSVVPPLIVLPKEGSLTTSLSLLIKKCLVESEHMSMGGSIVVEKCAELIWIETSRYLLAEYVSIW